MNTIDGFVKLLKKHIAENPDAFCTTRECGDTRSGFMSYDAFDYDKLCLEIDKFAATFKS
jgi:hypothetical protein